MEVLKLAKNGKQTSSKQTIKKQNANNQRKDLCSNKYVKLVVKRTPTTATHGHDSGDSDTFQQGGGTGTDPHRDCWVWIEDQISLWFASGLSLSHRESRVWVTIIVVSPTLHQDISLR